MQLTIKYFGPLTDITGCREERFEFEKGKTVSELLIALHGKYPELAEQKFKVAHNRELAEGNTRVTSTEIGLLPPFAGG
ncbi:MoaD/ThiS family protein [Costertonia aggregata]|uniref:MoaD/ThiS family protein n=1 Tax=Costertonia aggregata TaxID=343403 RepID=A0A7H9AME8_9FLAO|nr:MoaD/ThiS family protein [Costertonia aggregata]QLG44632.1 MoaD/ThiS family protein [Costertonia aggregata]